MSQNFAELARVTDAVFQNRLAGLQRLAVEETMLRQSLTSLEEARRENLQVGRLDVEMRALGSDILWEGWIIRQRIALNMRLANLLVQKEALRVELRTAFGRAQVAKTLDRAEQAKARKIVNNRN